MALAELWVKVVRWLTTLDSKKIVIVLLSLIVSLILYDQYLLREENNKLKEENGRLYNSLTHSRDRTDSIMEVANRKLQDCNEARLKDVQATQEYWKNKFENLEERLHSEYRPIKRRK